MLSHFVVRARSAVADIRVSIRELAYQVADCHRPPLVRGRALSVHSLHRSLVVEPEGLFHSVFRSNHYGFVFQI